MMCFGLDGVDAIGQRRPGQMGVEERNHAADARDADPDREEFRPARHHQADRVALAHVLRQRPARVAVGARRKFAVGEALTVGEQRRRVAVLVREFQDDLREHARRIPGDRRGHPEGAQRAPEAGHLRRQPLDHSHDVPEPSPHPSPMASGVELKQQFQSSTWRRDWRGLQHRARAE